MKAIILLLLSLMLTALVSAEIQQNEAAASPNIQYQQSEVYLSITQIGVWWDGSRGKTYSQYDVTIVNNSNRNIRQIYIATDQTFRLRDNSSASLWNMVLTTGGILALPSYQNSINAHASYTFGFIIEGSQPPFLQIQSIQFQ